MRSQGTLFGHCTTMVPTRCQGYKYMAEYFRTESAKPVPDRA